MSSQARVRYGSVCILAVQAEQCIWKMCQILLQKPSLGALEGL